MLALFFLLLTFGALAVVAFSIGLVWLLLGEGGEGGEGAEEAAAAGRPLSLSQTLIRELEGRRVWRALSSWLAEKPARLEHRPDDERG